MSEYNIEMMTPRKQARLVPDEHCMICGEPLDKSYIELTPGVYVHKLCIKRDRERRKQDKIADFIDITIDDY